jgi:hypothetical protein
LDRISKPHDRQEVDSHRELAFTAEQTATRTHVNHAAGSINTSARPTTSAFDFVPRIPTNKRVAMVIIQLKLNCEELRRHNARKEQRNDSITSWIVHGAMPLHGLSGQCCGCLIVYSRTMDGLLSRKNGANYTLISVLIVPKPRPGLLGRYFGSFSLEELVSNLQFIMQKL